jgi:hypothetical protein
MQVAVAVVVVTVMETARQVEQVEVEQVATGDMLEHKLLQRLGQYMEQVVAVQDTLKPQHLEMVQQV